MSNLNISTQISRLQDIRRVLQSTTAKAMNLRPAERDLLVDACDAALETLAFNEKHEAAFRAWFREKHGSEA